MQAPIVNIATVIANPDLTEVRARRGKYESTLGLIGKALGTRGIGINVTIVPPGRAAFPRHYHFINDEMFIVLDGTGTLHFGEEDYPISPLDVIHIEGGTGTPFQIDNTSEGELRYLALSTLLPADLFHYPDSGKFGIMARGAPFRDLADPDGLPRFTRFIPGDASAGYYDGDPAAEDETSP